MKKRLNFNRAVLSAVSLGFLIATVPAMAADGEVTFNGNVLATTCTIGAGGGAVGDRNMTVKLPSVSVSALAKAGDIAGRTPFSILLTGCTGGSTKVSAVFEPGDTVDSSTGRLKLISTGDTDTVAKNVEINLLNSSQKPLRAGVASGQQNSQVVTLKDGGATLTYFAEYYATGTATAGSANTRVQYSLDYQ